MADFIDRNIDSPFDLLTPNLARLVAIGGFRRMAPKANDYLKDPRTQRVFSFQAMYAGMSPHDALSIYSVIAYMDSVAGVFFPKGGMHAVPAAMAAAAEKHGVIDPLLHDGRLGRARRVAGVGGHHHRRRADPGRRGRAEPGPAGRLPGPARPRAVERPAADLLPELRGAAGRLVGAVLEDRPPQHPLRPVLGGRVHRPHRPRPAHGRPEPVPDQPDAVRPVAGPGRQAVVLRAVPDAEPRCPDRLDGRGAALPRPHGLGARGARVRRLRRRHRGGAPDHAAGLGRAGHGARARRSPPRTRSSRPDRSARATGGARTWCSPGPGPSRAWACRWC